MNTTENKKNKSILHHGTGQTPFGPVLLLFSRRGLCALRLLGHTSGSRHDVLLRQTARDFPGAHLTEDQAGTKALLKEINDILAGRTDPWQLKLDLRGTPFQKKVWQALVRIPRGQTCSYSDLARRVGKPRAVRAVASACARNPVGLVVPCHRVLRSDGSLGGYYWGQERKRQILRFENVEV